MSGNLRHFRRRQLTPEEGRLAAKRLISTPMEERSAKARDLFLDDPETVLPVLGLLRDSLESSPVTVRDDAEFMYRFLEKIEDPGQIFLFDEREYFMGEAARIAAIACRHLSRRDEARLWLRRAEGYFLLTVDSNRAVSLLSYQTLALMAEERHFDEVLELLPPLILGFKKLGAAEEVLKCRSLHAVILKETHALDEAATVFVEIVREAKEIGKEKIVGSAYVNLFQLHAERGDDASALAVSEQAVPLLKRMGNRIDLAKIQWGTGMLLRTQGNPAGAIEALRSAQREFTELGMHADVAAFHLVVADILLDAKQDAQAEWEIRAALPIIDEFQMVPEGIAALSLLRESVRRRQIDRIALRNLHGYFPRG